MRTIGTHVAGHLVLQQGWKGRNHEAAASEEGGVDGRAGGEGRGADGGGGRNRVDVVANRHGKEELPYVCCKVWPCTKLPLDGKLVLNSEY